MSSWVKLLSELKHPATMYICYKKVSAYLPLVPDKKYMRLFTIAQHSFSVFYPDTLIDNKTQSD